MVKKEHDFSINAFRIVEQATKDTQSIEVIAIQIEGKNPHAVELGRLGGLRVAKQGLLN